MKILAVEFSTDHRSVAVLASVSLSASGAEGRGEVASSLNPPPVQSALQVLGTAAETTTRSTPAFALIEKALAEARMEREEIECLAIGLGPGSYTGIRAAIALAQGWQLARPIKLLGISSAECLAAEARAQNFFGTVNVVIDAQRNELYVARYQITADDFREISPLALASPDAVRPRLSAGETVVGPDATRWFANAKILFPNAATLGRLASGRANFLPGEKLEPIYLREPNFVKAPPPRILPGG